MKKLERTTEKLKAKEVEQKNIIKGNMKEIEALNSENQLLHKLLSSEKEYIKKLKKSLEYFKEKSNSQIKGEIYIRNEKIKLLQEQVKELMKEKEYLQELLDFTESPVVTAYEKGKYADSITQKYIKLLNMKVRRNNVKEVIETVLGDLTNVIIDEPLPSAALTSMLFTEGRTLANLHVATELQNNENSANLARKHVLFRSLLEIRLMQWAYLTKMLAHQKAYLILSKNALKKPLTIFSILQNLMNLRNCC